MKKLIKFINIIFHIHSPIKGGLIHYSSDPAGGWYEYKCECGKQIITTVL